MSPFRAPERRPALSDVGFAPPRMIPKGFPRPIGHLPGVVSSKRQLVGAEALRGGASRVEFSAGGFLPPCAAPVAESCRG